jgi:hypothetical protein
MTHRVRLQADWTQIGPAKAGHYSAAKAGHYIAVVVAIVAASTMTMAEQVGGKLVSGGNPTPGIEQPAPPNLSDRMTVSGCLRAVTKGANAPSDPNEPSDARFMLANAERVNRLPPGTGGSPLAAGATARTYRLAGIDSQFSPFVGAKVEISGEIKAPSSEARSDAPTLIVAFVQKIDSVCK